MSSPCESPDTERQRGEGGLFCGSPDILSLSLSLPPPLSLAHLLLEFGSAQHPRHGEQDGCFLLAKTVVIVEFVPTKKKVKELKSKKDGCFSLAKTVAVVESMPNYKYCNVYFICRL